MAFTFSINKTLSVKTIGYGMEILEEEDETNSHVENKIHWSNKQHLVKYVNISNCKIPSSKEL